MLKKRFWLVLTLCGLIPCSATWGASTWDGSGPNNNWSSAINWNPNGVPANDGTADLTFTGSTRLSPNVDTAWDVKHLTFTATSAAFTLSGSDLSIGSSGLDVTDSGLFVTHTVNNNLALTANQTWTTAGDSLRVAGNIDLGSHKLTAYGVPGTGALTVDGQITGSGSIVVTKTAYLNGANSFSGGTEVTGFVYLGSDTAAGTGAITLNDGWLEGENGNRTIANNISVTGSFGLNIVSAGSGDLTLTGTISGASQLWLSTGTIILTGNNSGFSGGIANLGGVTLGVGHDNALGTGTLQFSTGTIQAYGGTRSLANSVSFLGDPTFAGSDSLMFSGNVTITGNRTFTSTSTSSTAFLGVIGQDAAGRALTVQATSGSVFLSGANTFSGGLTIDSAGGSGTVYFGHDDAAGSGTLTLKSGKLAAAGGSRFIYNPVHLRGDFEIATGYGVEFYDDITIGTPLGLNGNITLRNNNSAGSTRLFGAIGQTGISWGLTIQPYAGSIYLMGNNTFTGGLTMDSDGGTGTLVIGHDNAAGTGTLTLTAGSIQAYLAPRTLSNAVAVNGDVTISGSVALTFSGPATLTGGNRNLTITNSAPTTFSGAIGQDTAGRSLQITGNATFGGSSANTYSGDTTVSGGTLTLNKTAGTTAIAGDLHIAASTGPTNTVQHSADDQIADTAQVVVGSASVLDLNGHNETIGSLRLDTGSVTTGAGTLTLDGNLVSSGVVGTATISGKLSLGGGVRTMVVASGTGVVDLSISAAISNGSLTKSGTGQLSFDGTSSNQYTGDTLVNTGTLRLGKTAGAQAIRGDLIVGDGVGGPNSDLVSYAAHNQIANTSNVIIRKSGWLDLNGQDDTFRTLTMTGGYVSTGAGIVSLTGGITTTSSTDVAYISGQLNVPGSQLIDVALGSAAYDLEISATVSGGDLIKSGAGTLRLSGAASNAHLGNTVVNAGTLSLAKNAPFNAVPNALIVGDNFGAPGNATAKLFLPNQIADSAAVYVNQSGILDLNGMPETINSLTVSSGSVFTGAGTLFVNNGVNSTGLIGTGLISGRLDLGAGGSFTVTDGSAPTDLRVTAIITNGSLTKLGLGTMELTAMNTAAGIAFVEDGVLALSSANALGSVVSLHLNGGALSLLGPTGLDRVNDLAPVYFDGGELRAQSHDEVFSGLILNTDSRIVLMPDPIHEDLQFGYAIRSGGLLKIAGWVGMPGVGGSDDRIFIGGALAANVLPNIQFEGYAPGAIRLGTNEIVPIAALPEPSSFVLLGGGLVLAGIGYRRRRR